MHSRITLLVAALAAATAAQAASLAPVRNTSESAAFDSARMRDVPLRGWTTDVKAGIAQLNATAPAGKTPRASTKAATDPVTVFRPIVPCRLFDTRGLPAAIQGTTFAPNTRQTVPAGNQCGIPNSFVKGLSVTLITFNHTVNTGGFISLVAPAAAITGTNDTFNFGAQWSGTSVNVPTAPGGGSNTAFDVYVSQATADVIIDVNGYYQDLDFMDIGTQQFDIQGNTTGETFEVINNSTGAAIAASNFSGGPSLTLFGGAFRVAGAAVGAPYAATILQVDTSSAFGSGGSGNICGGNSSVAVIDHPMLNGKSSVLAIVTPRANAGGTQPGPGPFELYYQPSCAPSAAGFWALHDRSSAALVNGSQYNILVITP